MQRRHSQYAVNRHVLDGKWVAYVLRWQRGRKCSVLARHTTLVVGNDLVLATLDAHPAAVNALYLANVAGRARLATHRRRRFFVVMFPARQRFVDVQPVSK